MKKLLCFLLFSYRYCAVAVVPERVMILKLNTAKSPDNYRKELVNRLRNQIAGRMMSEANAIFK